MKFTGHAKTSQRRSLIRVDDDEEEEWGAGDNESCHTDIGEDRYVDDEAEEET
jgi:hypothetical protein